MRLLPVLIAAVVFVGCGGSEPAKPGDPQSTFAGTCGGCHTLAAAGTGGGIGPNLDDLMPDKARVLAAIQEGPGAMQPGLLDGEVADEVAAYVADNAGG